MTDEPSEGPDEVPIEAPRIRDAERSRARILEAAERIFARRGFAAARVADIGRVAGVSRGTPGYFFRSKEALYRTVMEQLFADAAAALARVEAQVQVEGGEPWHLLEKCIDGYLAFLAERPGFVRLVQWECATEGPFIAQVAGHFEALCGLFERLLAAGGTRFRPMDPVQLMLTVVGAAWLPFALEDSVLPLVRVDADDATFLANRRRHLVELVLHGASVPVGPGTSTAAARYVLPPAPRMEHSRRAVPPVESPRPPAWRVAGE